MGDERSLLQQIGDKERELGARLKAVSMETEGQIAAARQKAADQVSRADEAGKRAAGEYLEQEREKSAGEIAGIKATGQRDIAAVRERGEPTLSRAADMIIRHVAPE